MTTTLRSCLLALLCGASIASGAHAGSPRSIEVKLNDTGVALDVRVKQAKQLGRDNNPKAIDLLLQGLDSRDEVLRAAIIASLKAQNGDLVLLLRAADAKRPSAERVAALGGIRALKPPKAGLKLAALLDDKDAGVREAAAHALCVVGTAEAEARLVQGLNTEASSQVRYFIAVALGELKTPAAKQAVAAQLKSETDFVVKDALEQATTKQARP